MGDRVLITIHQIQNDMFYLIILLGVFLNLAFNVHTRKQVRVYGGREAKLGEFPMMVELRDHTNDKHYCGGFLIRDQYVLTAAHCLVCEDTDEPCFDKTEIMTGDTTRNRFWWLLWLQPPPTRQVVRIRRVSIHEKFTMSGASDDIALIELEKPIKKSQYVDQTAIAKSSPKLHVYCKVVGWGRTRFSNGASAKKLMTAVVQIQNSNICELRLQGFDRRRMICAGDLQGRNDSCVGDSGGPLICGNIVVGIVSYGYNCAMPEYAAAYTDVAYYQDWVHDKLKKFMTNAFTEATKLKLFGSIFNCLIWMKCNCVTNMQTP